MSSGGLECLTSDSGKHIALKMMLTLDFFWKTLSVFVCVCVRETGNFSF